MWNDGLWAVLGRELPRLEGLGSGTRAGISQMAPVVLASLAILFAVIVWAVFIRKPQGSRDRGRMLVDRGGAAGPSRRSGTSGRSGGRRRRRDRRHRNPTLAEAGGLPPIRPSDAPPPGL
jgi:hypothetical protein